MTVKKSTDTKKDESMKKEDSANKKIKKLEKEIKQIKNDLKEKDDKIFRNMADFQNYQKRMEKELSNREEETKKRYISELIDLNELLFKAYEDKNPKEGLKLILNNIKNFFEKEKIRCIDCVGKTFDHNFHHAISTIEKEDCEDKTIIEEIKKGYLIEDKLLRPSQVIVAKKKDN
jgi:molecular chaperone GrpE